MTDLKFAILEKLYNAPLQELHHENLFNINTKMINETNASIRTLVGIKYIEKIIGSNKYHLTPSGANAFEDEQQKREQEAKRKREYIITTMLSVLTLLVSAAILIKDIFFSLINTAP